MNQKPPSYPQPKPDPANLDASELASNQGAKCVPWFCGTRKLPLTWIAPIDGLHSKKVKSPPPGLNSILQITQYEPGMSFFSEVGLKAEDASRATTTLFYGTIAGIPCSGPADELVALLMNGATVWPTRKVWNDTIIDIPTTRRRRLGGLAHLQFAVPHGLHTGNKFIVSGLSDASFNEAAATNVHNAGAMGIQYPNAGADVAWTNDVGGLVSKVAHYKAGDLVRDGAAVWEVKVGQDHDAMPATRPPNATYWSRYSVTRALTTNPFPFTIENIAQGYIYWGTDDQVLDVVGEKILAGTGHPPYRRQVVIVLVNCLLGTRPAAPNIEVILGKGPQQTIVGAGTDARDEEGQANPLVGSLELLTDPIFGIGQEVAIADGTSMQAVASDLLGEHAMTYISPLLENQMSFRAVVAAMMAYYDGWFRFNSTGVIEAGRFLHNEAPPGFVAATTLDFNDALEEISYVSEGWSSTYNEVLVKFQDLNRAYKAAGQKALSGLNRAIVGEPRLQSLDRPWITRELQALAHAVEWMKIYAQPVIQGAIEVRAEKTASIAQGGLFRLTHDAVSFSVVCRCIEKTLAGPPAMRARIKFENERGIAPLPYHATPTGLQSVLPASEDVSLSLLVQPPASLANSADFRVTLLAARKSELTHGVRVWLKAEDSDLFYNLGQQLFFGVNGLLSQNYAAASQKATAQRSRTSNVATLKVTAHGYVSGMHVAVSGLGGAGYNQSEVMITVTDADHFTYPNVAANEGVTGDVNGVVTPLGDDESESLQFNPDDFTLQTDLDRVSDTQTADAINDDALLAWVFKADLSASEIMTLREIRLDSGVYKLKVRRGRFGTAPVSFSTGDTIWIVHRSELVFYTHSQFGDYVAISQAATFRLQAFTASSEADLADDDLCPDIAFNFADSYAAVPSFPTTIQQRADQDSNFADVALASATVWDPSTQFHVVVRFDSPNSVVSGELDAVNGVQRIKLWSAEAQVVLGSWQSSVIFSLPSGNWFFDLTAIDQFGRVTKTRLNTDVDGGLSADALIQVLPTGSARNVGTITNPESGTYAPGVLAVSIIDPTLNGLIVRKYSLVNLGAAPGAYTNGNSVNITIAPGSGKTLYTKQTLAGVDSLVRRDDYIASSA